MLENMPIRSAAALCLCLVLLAGCSAFDRDWTAAAEGAAPENQTDITGRWQGTWASDVGGHTGGLRCIITRVDKDTYHARYDATYGGIFRFNYEMTLNGTVRQDWVHFDGSADLGPMAGGVYKYEGDANVEKFFATYHCDSDHGQFNMKRPE